MKNEDEQRKWILIARKLAGETDLKKEEELDGLLEKDSELEEKVFALSKLWKLEKHAARDSINDTRRILERIKNKEELYFITNKKYSLMFGNYFKTAWRNLLRNPVFSIINILGLSLGLAVAMLIILFVKDELSYDKHIPGHKNIYRIVSISSSEKSERFNSNTGVMQGPKFAENVPGIKRYTHVYGWSLDAKKGDDMFKYSGMRVDPDFMKIFSVPVLYGNANTCLNDPNGIVITEETAVKHFGSRDAIGKTMMIKGDSAMEPYAVTAVVKKIPSNSTVKYNFLLKFKMAADDLSNKQNWFNYYLNTFVELEPNADISKIESVMQKYFVAETKDFVAEMTKKYGPGPIDALPVPKLQPLTNIHLNKDLPAQNGLSDASDPIYSYILSVIALFVLIIACVNFINLTIARSAKRAKEIGIRKVVGGERKQLILQLLGESFALCFISFLFAIGIVALLLPLFNKFAAKEFSLLYLLDLRLLLLFAGLFILTVFISGFYPAFVLSSYDPVKTLYNRFRFTGKNYLQKSLVVFQFALASLLIVATLVIYFQFRYLSNFKLGYDESNVIVTGKFGITEGQLDILKNEVNTRGNIIDIAARNFGWSGTLVKLSGDSTMQITYETVTHNFIPLFKIPILKGRNFSRDYPSDSANSVIVNESFVKKAGWKEAINQTLTINNDNKKYKVIGVIKDYYYSSALSPVEPQLFTLNKGNTLGEIYVKIKEGSSSQVLPQLEKAYKKMFPMEFYNYSFKDVDTIAQYNRENKWKQIMTVGAILTIFISCIGLFGMSVLTAEKRTKEIGIRKVLGASVNGLSMLLSKDFIMLVLLALCISIPVGWMLANKWLQNYAFRFDLNWTLFALAAMITVAIALITVSFQAIKAATANPVKSLRTE